MRKQERLLIPGEDPTLTDFASARRWLTIYEQRRILLARDNNLNTQDAAAIAEGAEFWAARVAELSGLEIDAERRVLNIDSETQVQLTRRELQLLEFLLQHSDRYFADYTLAIRAWGDRLSGDQVRIYIRRLRTKLEGTKWELVSKRGQGYALVRREGMPVQAAHGEAGRGPSESLIGDVIARANALIARQQRNLELAVAAAETLRATLAVSDGSERKRSQVP